MFIHGITRPFLTDIAPNGVRQLLSRTDYKHSTPDGVRSFYFQPNSLNEVRTCTDVFPFFFCLVSSQSQSTPIHDLAPQ